MGLRFIERARKVFAEPSEFQFNSFTFEEEKVTLQGDLIDGVVGVVYIVYGIDIRSKRRKKCCEYVDHMRVGKYREKNPSGYEDLIRNEDRVTESHAGE